MCIREQGEAAILNFVVKIQRCEVWCDLESKHYR